MKKVSLFAIGAIAMFFVTLTAQSKGIGDEFGKFEITEVEDVNFGSKAEKAWTISYSSDAIPVTVVKRSMHNGVEYTVHSKFFEVCYGTSKNGFGARKIRNSWSSVPAEINNAVLNPGEMERQRILTPNLVDDKTALDLIASFLPHLLNSNYTHLLN